MIDATRWQPGSGTTASWPVQGPIHGSGIARMVGGENRLLRIKLAPDIKTDSESTASQSPPDELPRGDLQVHAGKSRYEMPLVFLPVGSASKQSPASEQGDDPVIHYKFDFARDGSDDWVLENSHLRLMLSPTDGGRALAWVDKSSSLSLFTSVGRWYDRHRHAWSYNRRSAAYRCSI